MSSINSILSLDDYGWNLPAVSDGISQENLTFTYAPAPHESNTFTPFEGLHPVTAHTSQDVDTFGDHHLYDSREDVTMTEGMDSQHHREASAGHPSPPATNTQRARYGTMDWESHKEEMKQLYLTQDKTLDETMRIMNEKYLIPESKKTYKDRFKAWGWQKNLPGQYAQWMTQKANKRKRDDGKDTVFFYGGLQWDKSKVQKSAIRSEQSQKSKKVSTRAEVVVVDTPNEIDYRTPKDDVVSPRNALSQGGPYTRVPGRRFVVGAIEAESESEESVPELRLRWRGHSRSELVAIFDAARSYDSRSEAEEAEATFLKALEGYTHLLGPTHEDTTKVAFAVASFYTEQDRHADADRILEDTCRSHVSKFGIEDRRSQQLVLQLVELLNGWNRQSDTLAFLARSKELAEADTDIVPSSTKRQKVRQQNKKSQRQATAPNSALLNIAEEILGGDDPARINHGIDVARVHVAAKDVAVETFLKTIIYRCGRDNERFEIQDLRARSELLKLYNKLERSVNQTEDFMSAVRTAETAIARQKWDKRCFKSFEVMEAVLELTACVLKAGFEFEALKTFQSVERKAEDGFGWDEERTIWAKITIGIIYQRYKSWEHAKLWFQHAHAASFTANGDEDGITMSLEAALEKHHFSYVSDEGRPFKTIFGVSGLAIRPNRLYIE